MKRRGFIAALAGLVIGGTIGKVAGRTSGRELAQGGVYSEALDMRGMSDIYIYGPYSGGIKSKGSCFIGERKTQTQIRRDLREFNRESERIEKALNSLTQNAGKG